MIELLSDGNREVDSESPILDFHVQFHCSSIAIRVSFLIKRTRTNQTKIEESECDDCGEA